MLLLLIAAVKFEICFLLIEINTGRTTCINAKEIPIHQNQYSGNTSHSLCTPLGRKSVKTLIFIKLQFPAGKSVKTLIFIKLQFPAQTKSYNINNLLLIRKIILVQEHFQPWVGILIIFMINMYLIPQSIHKLVLRKL